MEQAGLALAAFGPSDEIVRAPSSTFLGATGGIETRVMSLRLPAGSWIVHADDSAVGSSESADIVRCWLVARHGVHVGHATQVGGQNAPFVATLSDTIGIKLTATKTVYNTCSHDNTTSGTYYVDADATLWRTRHHRSPY